MRLFGTLLLSAACCCGMLADERVVLKPSQNYVTRRVSVGDISGISASASVDVVYTQQAGSPYAEVYGPDNLIPYIRVERQGKELKVGWQVGKNISIQGKCKYEVRVFAPEVTDFVSRSSADIRLATPLESRQDVRMEVHSSGDIKGGSVRCAGLSLSAHSSGDVELAQVACTAANIRTASSGDCEVGRLVCDGALSVEAHSSGDCKVRSLACQGDVTASAQSSADITLSGTCRNADLTASSSGSVFAKDLKAADVKAAASSAGEIQCQASGTLTPRVSSDGGVRYKGTPQRIDGRQSGVSPL